MADNYITAATEKGNVCISEDVIATIVGAAISEIDGVDGLLAGITKAAQDSAAQAAHRSGRTSYEAACEESQAAYDAFNPHKHKEA